jgi:hypothetical protein
MKNICRITYPNGNICIGKDITGTLNYFGSVNSILVNADFSYKEKRDFSIRKEILWESDSALDSEVNNKEVELILLNGSNNPEIGYNQWPKFKA